MVRLDGSLGEGGGGVLRSALSLSIAEGRPFRVSRIRAGRDRPGLRAQHLTALRAAARISGAEVSGDELGSQEIEFRPGPVRPGHYRFSTGGAGSAILVLQTLLPALARARVESTVEVEGGTHNPFAPPHDFLERTYLPLLDRLGPSVESELVRPGFYPAGGGLVRARIRPAGELRGFELTERGPVTCRRARAMVSALPRHIAEREVATAHAYLDLRPDALEVIEVRDPQGPGNAIMIEVETAHVTEVFTGFGRKGVPAEEVAKEACREARSYLDADAPVGPHLADQLLVPLALAGGGTYRITSATSHTRTNARVIEEFLDVRILWDEGDEPGTTIRVVD